MKNIVIAVIMSLIAIVFIPFQWMFQEGYSFSLATNAFFNTSSTTLIFYFLQVLLIVAFVMVVIESEKQKDTHLLQWVNVVMLLGFAYSRYIYYLVLALCAFILMALIQREKNKEKDDITTIIEDVKDKYISD